MARALAALRRPTLPACLIALACAFGLAACEFWVGDAVLSGPGGDRQRQILPLRAMLTRPSIHADAMEFCRVSGCGYDAVLARVTASGQEGDALSRSLHEPALLAGMIRTPRPTSKAIPAEVSVVPYEAQDWRGVEVALASRDQARQAFGIVLEHGPPDQGSRHFVVVIAAHREIAERLAAQAAD
jgi:hypothetical protein